MIQSPPGGNDTWRLSPLRFEFGHFLRKHPQRSIDLHVPVHARDPAQPPPLTDTRSLSSILPCSSISCFTLSAAAAVKISELLTEENKTGSGLRVFVQGGGCSGFQYGLMIEENGQGAGDQVFESNGIKLFVDPISVRYLKGAEVDFVDTITGGGFTIKNPNATSTCGCGSSFTVE